MTSPRINLYAAILFPRQQVLAMPSEVKNALEKARKWETRSKRAKRGWLTRKGFAPRLSAPTVRRYREKSYMWDTDAVCSCEDFPCCGCGNYNLG